MWIHRQTTPSAPMWSGPSSSILGRLAYIMGHCNVHCPKTNLNLYLKTKPVIAWLHAKVCLALCTYLLRRNQDLHRCIWHARFLCECSDFMGHFAAPIIDDLSVLSKGFLHFTATNVSLFKMKYSYILKRKILNACFFADSASSDH